MYLTKVKVKGSDYCFLDLCVVAALAIGAVPHKTVMCIARGRREYRTRAHPG
jgi:hypothetical protein